jgi:homoserine dehydrogenase
MSEVLGIGIAGLGTVGAEVARLITERGDHLAERAGRPIKVVAVLARDRTKDRGVDLSGVAWEDDAVALAARDDVGLVCEVIGGSEGTAKELVEAALDAGKSVVTANKALLAHHGTDLAKRAEAKGVALAYEAAVAGGIPIIRALRDGFVADRVRRVTGILNGTCNFILTVMRETGRAFDDVLAEAQELGYAEADPSFDVDGVDAAHKLALLTALCFGREVDFNSVHIEGIRRISPVDISFATELGYKIKLLGVAEIDGEGEQAGVSQRVHPCMVPISAPIAGVEDVFNAVTVEADPVGSGMLQGRGAGAGPTASAVLGDIVDIATGRMAPAFGRPAVSLAPAKAAPLSAHVGSFYIRLMVIDKPGVLADITGILRDEHVSMESMIQRGRDPMEMVPLVLVTHEVAESSMQAALAKISALDVVVEEPAMIRIVEG